MKTTIYGGSLRRALRTFPWCARIIRQGSDVLVFEYEADYRAWRAGIV